MSKQEVGLVGGLEPLEDRGGSSSRSVNLLALGQESGRMLCRSVMLSS
jgi:hypothetical protein